MDPTAMSSPSLPSSARLRRSLARRRVRELRREHPVIEWLYGRLIVTETALSDLAPDAPACARVLRCNGYAAKVDAGSILLDAQLAALSEASGEPLLESEKPALLVADRDPLVLRALRRVLERRYRVFVTTNAREALALLAAQSLDSVITEQDLDQAHAGVWLLEHAKASFPEVRRILVSEQPLADAIGTGATVEHWLRKGARLEVLLERIACSSERG